MALREKLQSFIIGPAPFSGSHSDFKSIILCGQLALALFLVGALYIVIDLANDVTSLVPFYSIMLVLAIIIIRLLQIRRYRLAKIVFVFCAAGLTFVFSSNDSYRAGVYIYFIVNALLAFTLFGASDRWLAFAAMVVILVFFYLSYVVGVKVIMVSPEEFNKIYEERYIRISFISNFVIGTSVSALIVYFLLDINNYSEKQILIKNDQLAKTNRELDRFVYSASHDLRAPLSSLLGLISVTKLSTTKEEQEACLNLMEGRVHSMEQFINEIIDYSRNARQEIKSERIQLRAIGQQVLEELKYIQGIEEVNITLAVDDQLTVECDRTRLKMVLSNVIGNAIKYRDRQKANQQVVISARHIDHWAEIEVKDNGEGIAAEHQSRIFDMFFRASENSQGSGLGLYIVKEAIDKLGGKIEVQSQAHTGTSFFIRLPRTS